jgi:hypothetical protein
MKTILIIFYDEHLAFSPTVLNLIELLGRECRLKVIAPPQVGYHKYSHPSVQYVELDWRLTGRFSRYRLRRLAQRLGVATPADLDLDTATYVKVHSLRNAVKNARFDSCIAIDPTSMWIAQSLGIKAHFLSLELLYRPMSNKVDFGNAESVCIQSPERLRAAALGGISCPVFYLPNSSIFVEAPSVQRLPKELLFCGTATRGFGIYTCLHFLQKYPEYRLTLQGTLPDDVLEDILKFWPELMDEGRLKVNSSYLLESEMNELVRQFRIGFCIYDTRYRHMANPNYQTAPSGKLWRYFAAGVPVIGLDIPGLAIVKERKCGVLVSLLTSASILDAVHLIEEDYTGFEQRCIDAAREYSFERCAAPYIRFLLE